MSLTRACDPVPLTGQSSATWPAACSLSAALSLSSSVKVPASITVRRGAPAAMIPSTVMSSAAGAGRLVMMVAASRATALASRRIVTPARAASRQRADSVSKPTTRQPAALRWRA